MPFLKQPKLFGIYPSDFFDLMNTVFNANSVVKIHKTTVRIC